MKLKELKNKGMNCENYIDYLIKQGFTTVLEVLKHE